MKSIKITFLLALLASFTFISCENEPLTGTFTDETGVVGGDGEGTSTGDYFPRAVGNKWEHTVSTGGSTVYEMISTSSIGGFTYYNFPDNNGFGAIRKSSASYFTRIAVNITSPAYIITGTPIEIKFLQDDAVVGTSWENPVTSVYTYVPVGGSPAIADATVNTNYKYTLEEKDISREVNGQVYENVIHVSHILETGLGTPDTIGDYYYAKDIGIIEYALDGTTYKLTSYTLN